MHVPLFSCPRLPFLHLFVCAQKRHPECFRHKSGSSENCVQSSSGHFVYLLASYADMSVVAGSAIVSHIPCTGVKSESTEMHVSEVMQYPHT